MVKVRSVPVLFIISLTNLIHVESEDLDNLLVDTTLGPILGREKKFEGKKINQWLGIPYAQPPIGDMRFRDPVAARPWEDIKTLDNEPPACPQRENSIYKILDKSFYMWVPTVGMSEDCLYLNVYTPTNAKQRGKVSVIVWIHGGGFDRGAISMDVYNPKMLVAKEDVIVVSIQYRLGVFGLLYLGVPEAPGNMGLKDQSLALRWVRDNIEQFGGNKDDITVMGESAGAASVGYHMISLQSRDLFNKSILQSGAPLPFWAFSSPAEALARSRKYAKDAGCKFEDTSAIADCMRKKSSSEILRSIKSMFSLTPTVDGEFITKSPFLSLKDKEYRQKAVLGGLVQNEGMSAILTFVSHVKKFDFSNFNKDDYEFSKRLLSLFFKLPLSKVENLTRFYADEYNTGDFLEYLSYLFGDAFASCATLDFLISILGADVPVYFYYYNHRAEKCLDPPYTEVMHGAEVPFQFGLPHWIKENYTDVDRQISDRVMKEWATFAKTGKPTWGRYLGDHSDFGELKSATDRFIMKRREPFCKAWEDNGRYYNIVSIAETKQFMMSLCELKFNTFICKALSFANMVKEVFRDLFNF